MADVAAVSEESFAGVEERVVAEKVVASGTRADMGGEDEGGDVAGLVVAVDGCEAVFAEFVWALAV